MEAATHCQSPQNNCRAQILLFFENLRNQGADKEAFVLHFDSISSLFHIQR